MKYCVAYVDRRDEAEPAFNEVEEILISYNHTDTTLPRFMEEHSHQTVNIRFSAAIPDDAQERLVGFHNKYHNIKLVISNRFYESHKDFLNQSGIPFYFYDAFASSWDMLDDLLATPVSDIYVNCELAFHMTIVANRIHEAGKSVRVIPNVASSSYMINSKRGMNSFFIRPEDTFLYENLVDVFEFQDASPIMSYKVYKSQKWFGKLNEIITNLDSAIDNRAIPSLFGATRIRCQKRCGAKGTCRVCKLVEQLSETMVNNDLIFKKGENY